MRDRTSPRILLLPDKDGFACQEPGCQDANKRWRRGADALRHMSLCRRAGDGHRTLYCLTETSNELGLFTRKQRLARREAASSVGRVLISVGRLASSVGRLLISVWRLLISVGRLLISVGRLARSVGR